MEVSSVSVAALVLSVGILTWLWKVLKWTWLTPKKLEKLLKKEGFSGNPYRVLSGDLKDLVRKTKEAKSKPINFSNDIIPRVIPALDEAIKRYGKNFYIWFGPVPRVHILDPELIKEVLMKTDDFQKPEQNVLGKKLANGLPSLEGEKWGRHRKIINPAFHLQKLKLMMPAFWLSCSEMVNKWETLIPSDGSCELDVWPYFEKMTSDVISRTAFGSSYEEGRRIFQLQKEQAEHFMNATRAVYIPGMRFLPSKMKSRVKEIDREVKFLLRGIINKKKRAMTAGGTASEDLLSILLESNMKEIKENNQKVGMSIEDVIDECKVFYFAGQETTSNLLVWTMVLLGKHREWQERARDEVLQVFGKEKPDFDGLSHLKIVTMILNEVLRLYPPLVVLVRKAQKEIKLGKFTIPAGVQVSLPTILVQHDQDLWGDDAKEFKPNRFSEGISKATKNQLSFFPFGWGPHICIGQQLAMIEAKIALAMILQRISFELSPSYAHAPHTIITLQPQHGAHIFIYKV